MTIHDNNDMDAYGLRQTQIREPQFSQAPAAQPQLDLRELQRMIATLNDEQLYPILMQAPARLLARALDQQLNSSTAVSSQAAQTAAPEAEAVGAELRTTNRRKTLRSGKIIYNNRMSVNDCQIRDMSETGCRIMMDSLIGVPNFFTLHILNGDVKHECEVVWRKANMMGVKYL